MHTYSRRTVIGSAATVALSSLMMSSLLNWPAHAHTHNALIPDAAGLLDMAPGWRYRILTRAGMAMTDGLRLPGDPDGMACFEQGGQLILMRNHELHTTEHAKGPLAGGGRYGGAVYDPAMAGGATRLTLDRTTGAIIDQRQVLLGTVNNCAGGPTPWGSWLSCEESVKRVGEDGCQRDHGYVFEVPVNGLSDGQPLRAMGRFLREATAVDPASGMVYMTEDRPDGLLYRFIPTTPGRLAAGGQLQCLARDPGRWIDLTDVDSPKDDLRHRGAAMGAQTFSRGEGIWWSPDGIYFTATTGGAAACGQIWRYRPDASSGGALGVFFESPSPDVFDMGDNLCVLPDGRLLICEDRQHGQNRLHMLAPDGRHTLIARYVGQTHSEFAGICATPDGRMLFVNLQDVGLTVALLPPEA